jgi:nucleoside-diphosphate-sugar epimerase
MSRVVVIGATGHIGTYLVPRLVDGGHEVIAVSRGTRGPYHASPQWDAVTQVTADREAEDAQGRFARAREMLGYTPRYSSLDALREALAWLVANGQADVGGQPLPPRQ